uniref:Reverse transcriptase domain-containing protein n=1 Tax=Meloidogyne enterolobii TaxID=390850 RepID=A0A6V7V006_MELEN|nr:unnamed protein product [Meloidogyne enterolobii]
MEENITQRTIICGDFNIDLHKSNNNSNLNLSDIFLDFMSRNNLTQHVKDNTRENSMIDLILSRPSELISQVKVDEPFSTSDHNKILFSIDAQCPKEIKNKILLRNLKTKTFDKLNLDIAANDWDVLLSIVFTSNDKYNIIIQNIFELFNKHFPLKPINKIITENYPQKIKDLIRRKLTLYRQIRNSQNNDTKMEYKIISKLLRKELNRINLVKEEKVISKGNNAIHKFFKSKLGNNRNIPYLIDSDGTIHSDNKAKCNLFATNFAKQFQKNNFILPEINQSDSCIGDTEFDIITISKILMKLPAINSTSPDGIPYLLLKRCHKTVAHVITEIFRIILDSGTIPDIWKTSYIIPIYKNGEKYITNNYRPISITCTLCRVFERILAMKIKHFLYANGILSSEQFGFLEGRSTTTQLLTMLDDFYTQLQDNKSIDVIYIDFSKAFDSVPIEILLRKLSNIGITGKIYQFIKEFLTGRSFRVKIENDFSDNFPISSGVPQGSVLGPLLFIIFINDLPKIFSGSINVKMYADDIKLYVAHNNDNTRDILVHDLKELEKWSLSNGLTISNEKCLAIYLGKNNTKKDYYINNNDVAKCNVARDLGRSKNLVFIYKTYIRPHLEYATQVWSGALNTQNSTRLERVQKYYTRQIFRRCGLVPKTYKDRLTVCNIDELSRRRGLADLYMAYNIMNSQTSLNPNKYFIFARSKRKPFMLQNKRYKNIGKNNFFIRIINPWNKLPKEFLGIKTIKTFKNHLKKKSP